MKSLILLVILCVLLCITSIGNAQSVKTIEYDSPIDWIITCPGGEELIGSFKMVITIVNTKDGTWHATHGHVVGGVAVGQTTGTIYHTVGASNMVSNQSGASNFTYRDNAIFVATGKDGVSWHAFYTWHITVTPDGNASVVIDEYRSQCK